MERLEELKKRLAECCPGLELRADEPMSKHTTFRIGGPARLFLVPRTAAELEAAIPMLEGLSDWTQDAIHDGLIALAERLEVKNATLMWPVRIAAAGQAVTPGGAVEICRILGKDETLRRLKLGLDKLNV